MEVRDRFLILRLHWAASTNLMKTSANAPSKEPAPMIIPTSANGGARSSRKPARIGGHRLLRVPFRSRSRFTVARTCGWGKSVGNRNTAGHTGVPEEPATAASTAHGIEIG